jgi:hypothetical protein
MDIERHTDVLHRELEVITRILGKVAVVLFLICCAIYVSPGKAAGIGVMTADPRTGATAEIESHRLTVE